jgi:hypothetical protein
MIGRLAQLLPERATGGNAPIIHTLPEEIVDRRRVVITGMGILSPIGNSIADAWQHASNGISGIDLITRFDTTDLPVTFGGEVRVSTP